MPRPHRPNPYQGVRDRHPGGDPAKRPWRVSHVPQETRAEAKARKRAEAEARNPKPPKEA